MSTKILFIDNIQDRVDLGLKIGWKILKNKGTGTYTLSAPERFECKNFASIWTSYELKQGKILIPNYFLNDYIMTTGTWKEIELPSRIIMTE
jgi:hypothetical protein